MAAPIDDREQLRQPGVGGRERRLGRPAAAHADDHGIAVAQQRRPVPGHRGLAGALAGADHGQLRPSRRRPARSAAGRAAGRGPRSAARGGGPAPPAAASRSGAAPARRRGRRRRPRRGEPPQRLAPVRSRPGARRRSSSGPGGSFSSPPQKMTPARSRRSSTSRTAAGWCSPSISAMTATRHPCAVSPKSDWSFSYSYVRGSNEMIASCSWKGYLRNTVTRSGLASITL